MLLELESNETVLQVKGFRLAWLRLSFKSDFVIVPFYFASFMPSPTVTPIYQNRHVLIKMMAKNIYKEIFI